MATKIPKLAKNRRSLPQIPPLTDAVSYVNGTKENRQPNSAATTPILSKADKTKTIVVAELSTPILSSNGTKYDAGTAKENLKTLVGRVKHGVDKGEEMGTPECYNHVVIDPPRKTPVKNRSGSVRNLHGLIEEDSSSVTVAVRVRPLNQREIDRGDTKCAVSMQDSETIVTSETGASHNFFYDHCFWSFSAKDKHFADQELVYDKLARPLLGSAFQGYNTCLFAYGQTGSGKSYSIMGQTDNPGIVPRFSEELFSRIENSMDDNVIFNTEISYFEIYNEKIHDLLGSSMDKGKKKATLRVREHPILGPYVEGLSTYIAKSYDDITGWLTLGNKQRATAATGMNDKSSRSHSVFTIVLTQKKTEMIEGEAHEHSRTSRINLIDLAGSERCVQAQTSGDRLREGASINKSLHTLGKVISALSERSIHKKKKVFIPYRDSVLTWLLKESLGGNSKTAMIATIGPSSAHFEETMSTLRYAKQARTIVNVAKVNEDPSARLIRELRAEIEKLKGQSQGGMVSETDYQSSLSEIASLKEKLLESEQAMTEATKAWEEKLKQSEKRKMEESKELERAGVSFKVDNKLPNLVNLNEDPQLSEVLLYLLKEGTNRVGHISGDSQFEIQLSGALVSEAHCNITHLDDIVTVSPLGQAQTFVNGAQITEPTVLHHGDRLVIGDHYFRVNHLHEIRSGRRKSATGTPIDFEFAKNELITAQNAKLEAELEEARLKAQEEIMAEIQKAKELAQQQMDTQRNDYEYRMSRLEEQLRKESETREQEERVKQKAVEKIEALEEQKKILEQEVQSNRKRLQMEALAAKHALEDTKFYQARILQELDNEKHKLERDVERLHRAKKLREQKTKKGLDAKKNSRRDLLRMSMWLQEANNISKCLKKHTMFSRHDEMEGEEVTFKIRLNNTKLGITTLWSLEKFEDRLIQMREIYQQGGGADSNSDDLFYDPNDQWEKDYKIQNSPVFKAQGFDSFKTPTSSRLSSLSSRTSSIPSTPSSVGRLTPKTPVSGLNTRTSVSSVQSNTCQTVHQLCRSLLMTSLDRFNNISSQEFSVVDMILTDMQRLKSAVENIDKFCHRMGDDGADSELSENPDYLPKQILEASASADLLLSHISLWSSYHSSFDSGIVRDLTEQMVDTTRKTAGNVVKLLQGCDSEIDSMVSESYKQLIQSIDFLAKIVGELAIATETEMLGFAADADGNKEEISPSIKQAFLDGVDVFIDRTLQGGLKTINECEGKLKESIHNEMSRNDSCDSILTKLHMVVVMVRLVLMKCQDVQVELASTFSNTTIDNIKPNSYYNKHYQRAQNLITEAGNITDNTKALFTACLSVPKGQRADLRKLKRYTDTVMKTASQVYVASSTAEIICTPQEDQSEASDVSSASSLATEAQMNSQVYLAVQEVEVAAKSFIETLDDQLKREKGHNENSPSRGGKRLLPASPEISQINRIRKRLNMVDSVVEQESR
ncbi:kinesin-like protein KIF14 isoform X2 [Ptychodera flava]|uniref:kinesin-like protein KIF14 isoform X2 n=1 Tax=Ptychodera flava TaxID=63121 RepID=UPI00396AA336